MYRGGAGMAAVTTAIAVVQEATEGKSGWLSWKVKVMIHKVRRKKNSPTGRFDVRDCLERATPCYVKIKQIRRRGDCRKRCTAAGEINEIP